MNNKQIIVMWLGIVVSALILLAHLEDLPFDIGDKAALVLSLLIVSLITAGLLITFKDRKKD